MDRPVSGKTIWYEDLRVIGVLLVVVGVLALPLVWFNKKFTVQKKITITMISVAIACFLLWLGVQLSEVLDSRATRSREQREALGAQIKSSIARTDLTASVDSDRPVS